MSDLHVDPVDRPQWQRLVTLFADHNYRQCWDFGVACAQRIGAASEHVAIWRDNELLGVGDVRIRCAPGVGGIAYINGGPLVCLRGSGGSDEDAARMRACAEALSNEYLLRRGLVLRIRLAPRSGGWSHACASVLAAEGFRTVRATDPYQTILVDVSRPLEVIRKSLDQKWRNGLNRSEKNGLELIEGNSKDLFQEFCRIFGDLKKRKSFEVELEPAFYMGVQEAMDEPERFQIFVVEHAGHPVAGHVSSVLGDTSVYLLGASTEEGLQLKASYLLQWNAIAVAQRHGCRWYDLGGIDAVANPGVYHFKQGMAGLEVSVPGPFERRPGGIRGLVLTAAERVHRSLLRNRR